MTVLYPNLCYNEGCYKGTVMYLYEGLNGLPLKSLISKIWAKNR